MKTKEFLKKHSACPEIAKWALSIGDDMADVWDALVEKEKHDWLIWTATRPGVFPDSSLRKLACRFVRETPLSDGRKVWDLLTDERSRKAVEVAEAYADGKATAQELETACAAYAAAYAVARDAAYTAAYAAAYAAYAAEATAYAVARDAAYTAAFAAASSAAHAAAAAAAAAARAAAAATRSDAKAAQARMIVELVNPFKERAGR